MLARKKSAKAAAHAGDDDADAKPNTQPSGRLPRKQSSPIARAGRKAAPTSKMATTVDVSEPVSKPLASDPTVRTCPFTPEGFVPVPYADVDGLEIASTFDLLAYRTRMAPTADCLGWRPTLPAGFVAPPPGSPPDESRPYQWWSYSDTLKRAVAVGAGLVAKFGLSKGDCVGMYARNCPWWSAVMLGLVSQGIIIVPVYDTLGPNIVEYVCNHASTKVVCVSADNYGKLKAALPNCTTVQGVVLMEMDGSDSPTDKTSECVSEGPIADKVQVMHMSDVVSAAGDVGNVGADASGIDTMLARANRPSLDDTYVIMYTSGTTGNPKGVVLKNKAIMASVASAYKFFEAYGQAFGPSDSVLSYLPLSHIYEQQAEALFFGCGGKIGFYSGDIKLLLDDLSALKPTVFIGVPRVYARFQERIKGNVENASFIQRKLFELAYARQLRSEQSPPGPDHVARMGLWDSLVFSKVRGRILPNARLAITGSAPMSGQTNDFLKVSLNLELVQGYGLTETVGGMNCSAPGASLSGTCGGPLPGVLVKLEDVPEMGYTNSDTPAPRGEICVKGDIVFTEYFKNETATKEVFDSDGFFHTGDIGQWNKDGSLQVIDRKKNLFKLSQGEYVSPETLEQEYAKCKLVGQVWVYGNSLESTLLAVVVPDLPAAKEWASANGGGASDTSFNLGSTAALPAFKAEVLKQLAEMREVSKFKKYEAIKDCIIETDGLNDLGQGFHVDNDLMTPTFKLKRPQLTRKYKDDLDKLYAAAK